MSRKEDFKKAAADYVDGEPDGAQKIVGQVGFEFGAEYGYQYAVDKACEWLKNHSETDYYELIPNANYCGAVKLNKNKMIEDLCRAMEE